MSLSLSHQFYEGVGNSCTCIKYYGVVVLEKHRNFDYENSVKSSILLNYLLSYLGFFATNWFYLNDKNCSSLSQKRYLFSQKPYNQINVHASSCDQLISFLPMLILFIFDLWKLFFTIFYFFIRGCIYIIYIIVFV